MKALITGASGFVGGAIMRRARELGWDVRGIGRRPLPDPGYVSADLSRPFGLDFQPDVVIHAAARSSPWGRARDYQRQNVTATQNVLDFCATHGRPQLIHISTAAVVYRNEHQLAVTEDAPIPPKAVNEYARTKALAEKQVRAYAGDWCILRPRAVFGPGDTVVFPRILRAIQNGRLPIIRSDQPAVGDLIYIDALVDYILRAAERRCTGVYHVTNHEPVEIYSFINRICAQLNLPAPTRRVSAARAFRAARLIEALYCALPFLGEPPLTRFGVSVFAYSKTFDVTRTLRDLGPPSVSLAEGVARFVAWQRPRLSLMAGPAHPAPSP